MTGYGRLCIYTNEKQINQVYKLNSCETGYLLVVWHASHWYFAYPSHKGSMNNTINMHIPNAWIPNYWLLGHNPEFKWTAILILPNENRKGARLLLKERKRPHPTIKKMVVRYSDVYFVYWNVFSNFAMCYCLHLFLTHFTCGVKTWG
jgi:hypothetical protein